MGTAELEHCVAGYLVPAYVADAGKMLFVEALAELAFEDPQEHSNTLSSEVVHTTVVENVFVLHLLIEGIEDSWRDKKCPAVAVVAAVVAAAVDDDDDDVAAAAAAAAAIGSLDALVAENEYIVAYRDRRRAAGSQGHDNIDRLE